MKTYTLENLLPPDVLETRVEVLDALRQVLHLALVGASDLGRLADGQVELQLDAAVGVVLRQPALPARVGRRGEADLVLAGLGRGEGEAPRA